MVVGVCGVEIGGAALLQAFGTALRARKLVVVACVTSLRSSLL